MKASLITHTSLVLCLFVLMLYVPFNNFSVISGRFLSRLNQCEAADKVSCSRTQHSDSGESRTYNPSIPSLTLYELIHCAPHTNSLGSLQIRPLGYTTFSFSTQLSMKFQLLIKPKMLKINTVFDFKRSDVVFIMLINVKMPTIVGILIED